jgi:hypothetical protein
MNCEYHCQSVLWPCGLVRAVRNLIASLVRGWQELRAALAQIG